MATADRSLGLSRGRVLVLVLGLAALAVLMLPATGKAQDGIDQELTQECSRTTLLLGASCTINYTCPSISDGCTIRGTVDVDAAPTGLISGNVVTRSGSEAAGAACGGGLASACHAETGSLEVSPGGQASVQCSSTNTVALVLMDLDCRADITVTFAADVSVQGGTLVYTDWGGEQVNNPTLSFQGGLLRVDDTTATLDPGSGCTSVDSNTVTCDPSGVTAYSASLGSSGGEVETFVADSLSPGITTGTIGGGNGPDLLRGGSVAESINGGAGVDDIRGGAGDDVLNGGIDADPDLIDGASGEDRVLYSGRSQPVTVTLDGNADDGVAGEGDNVLQSVETVVGGLASDRLVGTSGSQTLIGGPGRDRFKASGGDDVIRANDGGIDTVIDCGLGHDRAFIDAGVDVAPVGCEVIN